MAPPSKKRKLVGGSGPAPKRSKKAPRAAKAKAKATRGRAAERVVDAGSLAWKAVGEELGGLEVVAGVDVVRDGSRVQFVVKEAWRDEGGGGGEQDDGSSFEGFGDDAVAGEGVGAGQAGRGQAGVADAEAGAGKAEAAKTTGQQAGAVARAGAAAGGGNSSGALTDVADAEEERADAQEERADAEHADDDEERGADVADWLALKLSPRVLSALARLGFARPTAIQRLAIPEIAAGEDVVGKAQTGSGKTLAFGIPIVERWLAHAADTHADAAAKTPMALVLSPTRELAKQLGDHLRALCSGLGGPAPYVCVVTGGLSVAKQQRQLARADVVVATPGRLWDLMDGDAALQRALARVRFLVVDEADRLLHAGQFDEAERIVAALDGGAGRDDALPPRQTLVFSATLDEHLHARLAGRRRAAAADPMAYLTQRLRFRRPPRLVDANPARRMAEGLREGLVECGAMDKDLFLYTLLLLNPRRRSLVFANSVAAVRRLAPLLQNLGLAALPLHSHMAQKARLAALERFAAADSVVLVATDVAARGLDVPAVDQVLHYHVPRSADAYIHRAGRSARAGRPGLSVLLCAPAEVLPTRRLAASVHARQSRKHVIPALPVDGATAARLRPRVDLAKRIADAVLARDSARASDAWLRAAAADLGVDYDPDDFDDGARRDRQARALSKPDLAALRARLRDELARRVNLGVSERYLAGGRVDVGALLRERERGVQGVFLGGHDGNLGLGL